ncbi:hypothetical protein ACQ4PT_055540 [Festuca glaucescens]
MVVEQARAQALVRIVMELVVAALLAQLVLAVVVAEEKPEGSPPFSLSRAGKFAQILHFTRRNHHAHAVAVAHACSHAIAIFAAVADAPSPSPTPSPAALPSSARRQPGQGERARPSPPPPPATSCAAAALHAARAPPRDHLADAAVRLADAADARSPATPPAASRSRSGRSMKCVAGRAHCSACAEDATGPADLLARRGREVHALCAKLGVDATPYVANMLATLYARRGDADGALAAIGRTGSRLADATDARSVANSLVTRASPAVSRQRMPCSGKALPRMLSLGARSYRPRRLLLCLLKCEGITVLARTSSLLLVS